MKSNFNIEILENASGGNDEVVAKIRIDEYEELFALSMEFFSTDDYLEQWYFSLKYLLENHNSVALMQWLVPGNIKRFRRGWIFYKLNNIVYIQDRLFPPDLEEIKFDHRGVPISVPERECYTEEGNRISEWQTKISDIYNFLENVEEI